MSLTLFVPLWSSVIALSLAIVVPARDQGGLCDPRYVVGQWEGSVPGAVGFTEADRTYVYRLGVRDLEWFTIKGTFTIQTNPNYRPSSYGITQYDLCVITLTPDPRTVEYKTGDLNLLASSGVLSNEERAFFVWKGQQAGLKLVFTQFSKPPSNDMKMMSLWPHGEFSAMR